MTAAKVRRRRTEPVEDVTETHAAPGRRRRPISARIHWECASKRYEHAPAFTLAVPPAFTGGPASARDAPIGFPSAHRHRPTPFVLEVCSIGMIDESKTLLVRGRLDENERQLRRIRLGVSAMGIGDQDLAALRAAVADQPGAIVSTRWAVPRPVGHDRYPFAKKERERKHEA